jgi:hypothetical protein
VFNRVEHGGPDQDLSARVSPAVRLARASRQATSFLSQPREALVE